MRKNASRVEIIITRSIENCTKNMSKICVALYSIFYTYLLISNVCVSNNEPTLEGKYTLAKSKPNKLFKVDTHLPFSQCLGVQLQQIHGKTLFDYDHYYKFLE